MRVLLCKIQCPSFICFCKPSPHISLKLENTPQVSSPTAVVDDHDDADDVHVIEEDVDHVDGLLKEEDCAAEEKEKEEEEEVDYSGEILKSSLKKAVSDLSDAEQREKKKKVQWVDLMGKELAEIREFESSEEEDIRYNGDQSCVCVIL